MPSIFHISVSGTVLAIYGAVLSTTTAVVQVVSFVRDKANIKVTYKRNMVADDPRYAGMVLTILKVVNVGKRPVTITYMGATRLYPHQGFICTDIVPRFPVELAEGQYAAAKINEADLDFEQMESFEVWDAVGREFRCNIAPLHKRIWSRFKRRLFRNK